MLKQLMLYPKHIFRFIRTIHVISKRINRIASGVPHRQFSKKNFIGLHTSSMNGFCNNLKWLVFLPLKSQSTQCVCKNFDPVVYCEKYICMPDNVLTGHVQHTYKIFLTLKVFCKLISTTPVCRESLLLHKLSSFLKCIYLNL